MPRKPSPPQAEPAEDTVMIGANQPRAYARMLARLHAETGRTKKQLQQEALDLLIASYRARGVEIVMEGHGP